ncbi:MAG: 2-C-methyl-D-erythritol 2,4-cyclodiphosphate synthase [Actinomycetota bacterium]
MTRVGIGVDAHAFEAGRPLVLGGVHFEGAMGLSGHSDADVICHAIADALLGAAGLGDLGDHFPNDDRWSEASSLDILRDAVGLVRVEGWSVGNIDVTVVAEAPPLAPVRDQMVANVADALGVDHDAVSIKATTSDGLGFTGRREGIGAIAVALVHK